MTEKTAGPEAEKSKPPKPEKKTVTVTVFAPNSTEGKEFTWPKTMKVGHAAQEAAKAFGYAQGSPTLAKDGRVLDRDKPLVAEHVEDGDRLDLVDTGGGV